MVKSLRIKASVFALILLLSGCEYVKTERKHSSALDSISTQKISNDQYPKFLQILDACYGAHFTILDSNKIRWNDGDTVLLDDGLTKGCQTAIENADIEDQFRTVYPKGKRLVPIDSCFDPGRVRNEVFFQKMYGEDEATVSANLDTVWWPSPDKEQLLLVNTVNGCRDSLVKVVRALKLLSDSMLVYVSPSAGTFKYRNIAGTNRLSCHSFGIAIDINVKYSNYWRWARNKDKVVYKNAIPFEIVELFEKYGFIWGGYWYHYDTMHFEFRPELIKFAE